MLQRIRVYFTQHQIGLLTTLIVHLLIGVVLMSIKVGTGIRFQDFEIELNLDPVAGQPAAVEQSRVQEKKSFEDELNQILAQSRTQVRNAAVDQSRPASETEHVLQEHEDLQRRISETHRMLHQEVTGDVPIANNKPKEQGRSETYTGPSVTAYNLPGRKANALPVPAYLCEEGGRVVVLIVVSQRGKVLSASIDQARSVAYECLQQSAKEAALRSRFNVGSTNKNEEGSISYLFVAQ